MMYVQCSLISDCLVDVRWLPEKFAKIGQSIIVKETGRAWVVRNTYSKANEKQVIQMRDLHKHHRKGTDI
ncbi:hypothetical protein [Paenibacillus polymyxa]|uniref:Uncharacterized protein n=1 Tax=Paenibacillus polymyxa (strain SC2) TaxID=886882 RepID=E3EKW5_PAEPS|nr:hypothetical protein [Paenibacillus polymyxa]ADO59870.1 hypothetical protein PPSC2_25845 [Paenibacillus polymyxa SC2]WPQ59902.1 hypothetical protein SKN87_27040 [Paenibacillus polymyxa]